MAERRKDYPLSLKKREDAKPLELKHAAAIRRPIYICPLPKSLFRPEVLDYLHRAAREKGFDPDKLHFVGTLKCNRRFFVYYVLFGLMTDTDTVVSAKDWPERALLRTPTQDEIFNLYQRDASLFATPDLWVSETTLRQLVDTGSAEVFPDGEVRWNDKRVGLSHKVADHMYSGGYSGIARSLKPVVYKKD